MFGFLRNILSLKCTTITNRWIQNPVILPRDLYQASTINYNTRTPSSAAISTLQVIHLTTHSDLPCFVPR